MPETRLQYLKGRNDMKKLFSVRLLSIILILAMICTVLSACGDPGGAATEGPSGEVSDLPDDSPTSEPNGTASTTFGIEPMPERTTLRLGYFAGVQHALVWYVADKEGFFDELNIDVEYSVFTAGPAMCEAIDSYDIGTMGGIGSLTGIKSYGVKVIGPTTYDTQLNLYVREDSPIAQAGKGHLKDYPEVYGTAETWRGTTWLLPMGTTLYKTIVSTLDKFGLTVNDITIVNMDVASAQAAFRAGQGDGMGQWATLAGQAETDGYVCVSGVRDAIPDTITCNMVASEDAIANKLDLLAKAYELYFRTYEWMQDHYDESVAYFQETCDEEGLLCDEESAKFSVDNLLSFTLEEALAQHYNMMDDPRGLAGRKITQVETDWLEGFDFLISIGSYTDEDRAFALNNDMVTNAVADAVKASIDARGN